MTQPSFATHEVFNQSPPFEDFDLFAVDRPLVEAVKANGGATAEGELSEFGKHWGSAAMAKQGFVNYAKEWWHFSLPGAGAAAYDFPIPPRTK